MCIQKFGVCIMILECWNLIDASHSDLRKKLSNCLTHPITILMITLMLIFKVVVVVFCIWWISFRKTFYVFLLLTIQGWGTNPNNPNTDRIYRADVSTITAEECTSYLVNPQINRSTQLCAMGNNDAGPCTVGFIDLIKQNCFLKYYFLSFHI